MKIMQKIKLGTLRNMPSKIIKTEDNGEEKINYYENCILLLKATDDIIYQTKDDEIPKKYTDVYGNKLFLSTGRVYEAITYPYKESDGYDCVHWDILNIEDHTIHIKGVHLLSYGFILKKWINIDELKDLNIWRNGIPELINTTENDGTDKQNKNYTSNAWSDSCIFIIEPKSDELIERFGKGDTLFTGCYTDLGIWDGDEFVHYKGWVLDGDNGELQEEEDGTKDFVIKKWMYCEDLLKIV